MKDFINAIITSIRTDREHTLREISAATGIQITRCHRLRQGKLPDADELIRLADYYKITATGATIEANRSGKREST